MRPPPLTTTTTTTATNFLLPSLQRPTIRPQVATPNATLCASCRRFSSRPTPPPPPPPSSGLVALSSRRLVSIAGPDAPKFLQGVITQNILAPSTPNSSSSSQVRTDAFYSAFLTATGRVLYDVFVYPGQRFHDQNNDASFLIEADAAEAARLEKHIRRYRLRARFDVRLLDPAEATVWHAWDDDNLSSSSSSSFASVDSGPSVAHVRDPRAPGLGWRIITRGERAPAVDMAPVENGQEAYRVRRYLHGVPEGQHELVGGAALPLEGNLDAMGAVDFRKGCYVGQELTIRTRHRGVVRKRVLPVVVYGEGDEAAPPPARLEYRTGLGDGDVAGGIPAEASIGRLGRKGRSAGKWLRGVGNIGLALCRLETMTDVVVVPGETTAASFDPADEFVVEWQQQSGGEEDGAQASSSRVKVKAFVPDWLRQRLEEQKHG